MTAALHPYSPPYQGSGRPFHPAGNGRGAISPFPTFAGSNGSRRLVEGFSRSHGSRGSPGSATIGIGSRPVLCRRASHRRSLRAYRAPPCPNRHGVGGCPCGPTCRGFRLGADGRAVHMGKAAHGFSESALRIALRRGGSTNVRGTGAHRRKGQGGAARAVLRSGSSLDGGVFPGDVWHVSSPGTIRWTNEHYRENQAAGDAVVAAGG